MRLNLTVRPLVFVNKCVLSIVILMMLCVAVRAQDDGEIRVLKNEIEVDGNRISVDVVLGIKNFFRNDKYLGFPELRLEGEKKVFGRKRLHREPSTGGPEEEGNTLWAVKYLWNPSSSFSCGEKIKVYVRRFTVSNDRAVDIPLGTFTLPAEGVWRGPKPATVAGPDTLAANPSGQASAIFTIVGELIDSFTMPKISLYEPISGTSVPTEVTIQESNVFVLPNGMVNYAQVIRVAADLRWLLQNQVELQLDISSALIIPDARQAFTKTITATIDAALRLNDTEAPTSTGTVTASTSEINLVPGFGIDSIEKVKLTIPDVEDSGSGVKRVTGVLIASFGAGSPENTAGFTVVPVGDAEPVKRVTPSGIVTDYCLTFLIPNLKGSERPESYQLLLGMIDRVGNASDITPEGGLIPVRPLPEGVGVLIDAAAAVANLITVTFIGGVGQFHVEASDPNSSGVGSIELRYVSPTGLDSVTFYGGISSRVSGDAISGVYEGSFSIGSFAEPGVWTLEFLKIQDVAGNDLILDSRFDDAFPAGVQTSFEVVNPEGDTDRPQLEAFNWDTTPIDVTSADVDVPFSLRATDAGIGVESITVEFTSAKGFFFGPPIVLTESNRTSGNAADGVYEGISTFFQNEPGIFIPRVTVTDKAGHIRTYGAIDPYYPVPDLNMPDGVAEAIEVVDSTVLPVNQPPVVTGWTLSSTELTQDGTDQSLSVTVQAGDPDDALSSRGGFSSEIVFTSPSGITIKKDFTPADRVSGNDEDGAYAFQVPVSRDAEPGNWRVHVDVLDTQFHRVTFGLQEGNLPPNSPGGLLIINTEPVDRELPFPERARFSPTVIAAGQETTLTMDLRITDDVSGFRSATWKASRPVGIGSIPFATGGLFGSTLDDSFEVTIPVSAADAVEGFITFSLLNISDKSSAINPNHRSTIYDSRLWNPQEFTSGSISLPFPYDAARVLVVEDADYALWAQTAFPENTPASKRHPAVDLDHDNLTNQEEFQNGTDPAVSDLVQPLDAFQISDVRFVGDVFQIQFEPYDAEATYTLRRNSNLSESFVAVENAVIELVDGVATIADPSPLSGQAFYHIVRSQ